MANDLLLLSSSAVHGSSYLAYALDEIDQFLEDREQIVFLPFASQDHDGYTDHVANHLNSVGIRVTGAHTVPDPAAAILEAGAVFAGGGNTFRLLRDLYRLDLINSIRQGVQQGAIRYMGASAGTNVACPTVRTTNDMPIVMPPSLDALGLVPFQINPHYVDSDPNSTHRGETREERILEFLQENDVPVLGLREGSWLRRIDDTLSLGGIPAARLFRRGQEPQELRWESDLGYLLSSRLYYDIAM